MECAKLSRLGFENGFCSVGNILPENECVLYVVGAESVWTIILVCSSIITGDISLDMLELR
jgi:hypothetical protein